MKKQIIKKTTVTVILQNTKERTDNQCLNGVFSFDAKKNRVLFEEEIRKGRPPRNPKLYDGKYISLVRMQNGRYQLHLKTMDTADFDRDTFAFGVYSEINNALKIID